MRSQRPFLLLWTLAVVATVAAFVLHLALRGRTVQLGYQLGRARSEQARLREIKRVLELEAASYETPQRVEVVARTLLGMRPPEADRIVPLGGPAVSPLPGAFERGPSRSSAPEPPVNAPHSPAGSSHSPASNTPASNTHSVPVATPEASAAPTRSPGPFKAGTQSEP